MWTSDRRRERLDRESAADCGAVTLEGDPAGAYLDGERRELGVYGPGGYCWKPALGDQVLVLKAGAQGETPCIAGKRQRDSGLEAGEVSIYNGRQTSGLKLRGDGRLELEGQVMVNGQNLIRLIQQVVYDILG